MSNKIGVVIGRFQTPELHVGHRNLLDTALNECGRLLVLLGTSPILNTEKDPLPYAARLEMIKESYPDALVSYMPNRKDNSDWARNVDKIISEMCPAMTPILYGGRDSSVKTYKESGGRHEIVELRAFTDVSASALREMAARTVGKTVDWRAAFIYACVNKYPRITSAVDICVVDPEVGKIMVATKPGCSEVRFPGGFVDIDDGSFLTAAKREIHEEAPGMELANWECVGSCKIDDWRLRGCEKSESIMSTFFTCTKVWGSPKAADDIDSVAWVALEEADRRMTAEHRPLLEMLKECRSLAATPA